MAATITETITQWVNDTLEKATTLGDEAKKLVKEYTEYLKTLPENETVKSVKQFAQEQAKKGTKYADDAVTAAQGYWNKNAPDDLKNITNKIYQGGQFVVQSVKDGSFWEKAKGWVGENKGLLIGGAIAAVGTMLFGGMFGGEGSGLLGNLFSFVLKAGLIVAGAAAGAYLGGEKFFGMFGGKSAAYTPSQQQIVKLDPGKNLELVKDGKPVGYNEKGEQVATSRPTTVSLPLKNYVSTTDKNRNDVALLEATGGNLEQFKVTGIGQLAKDINGKDIAVNVVLIPAKDQIAVNLKKGAVDAEALMQAMVGTPIETARTASQEAFSKNKDQAFMVLSEKDGKLTASAGTATIDGVTYDAVMTGKEVTLNGTKKAIFDAVELRKNGNPVKTLAVADITKGTSDETQSWRYTIQPNGVIVEPDVTKDTHVKEFLNKTLPGTVDREQGAAESETRKENDARLKAIVDFDKKADKSKPELHVLAQNGNDVTLLYIQNAQSNGKDITISRTLKGHIEGKDVVLDKRVERKDLEIREVPMNKVRISNAVNNGKVDTATILNDNEFNGVIRDSDVIQRNSPQGVQLVGTQYTPAQQREVGTGRAEIG